jgi:hypothetical protein
MLSVNVAPQWVTTAASDMGDIGSTLTAANAVTAAHTTAVPAAAKGEVSTAVPLACEASCRNRCRSTDDASAVSTYPPSLRVIVTVGTSASKFRSRDT